MFPCCCGGAAGWGGVGGFISLGASFLCLLRRRDRGGERWKSERWGDGAPLIGQAVPVLVFLLLHHIQGGVDPAGRNLGIPVRICWKLGDKYRDLIINP